LFKNRKLPNVPCNYFRLGAGIPKLTDKQLTQFRRPPKKLVAVRLDADVFEWLQQYGAGYSTRINNVLRVVMSRGRQ
jgi:uncharacterized protein (DUF4415 family)